MLTLIIKVALCGLVYWVCKTLGVEQPWLKIIFVVLVVVAIFMVLSAFGFDTGFSLK